MRSIVLVAVGIASSLSAAVAQQENQRDDGPYLRVGLGATFPGEFDQDFDAATTPGLATCQAIGCNPDRRVADLDEGLSPVLAIGFDYADGIRTELEYRFASADIDSLRVFEGDIDVTNSSLASVNSVAPVVDSFNTHFVFSNFYFDFYNSSRITPFVGGGVGGAFAISDQLGRDSALAYQGKAGVSVAFGPNISADIEYVYLRTNEFSFSGFDEGRYTSSSAMFSVRFKL